MSDQPKQNLPKTSKPSISRRSGILPRFNSNAKIEVLLIPKEERVFDFLNFHLKNVEIFQFLTDDQRMMLIQAMVLVEFRPNDYLLKQGDQPTKLYIIETGQCKVFKNFQGNEKKVISILTAGLCAGEISLISGAPQSYSVVAEVPTTAWSIDQKTYLVLLKEDHQKKRETYIGILSKIDLFTILDQNQIFLIIDALQPLDTFMGDVMINQGEEGDLFYMIIDGECAVSKPLTGDGSEIAVIRAGGYFGERALLMNEPRAATITCKTNCKLVKLDRKNFIRLMKPLMPKLLQRIQSYTK